MIGVNQGQCLRRRYTKPSSLREMSNQNVKSSMSVRCRISDGVKDEIQMRLI